jgi:GTP-binding protein
MTKVPGPDPLVIRSLEFLGGMAGAGGWRPELTLPEIAFAGRSNVGKSSLLNTLVRRKAFARVSRTPGRTREINFFNVNNQFILADLPGYGYARISKERKADWKPLIEGYLKQTSVLAGVVLLLDIRRDPSEDDMAMLDFLAEAELPTIIALTKVDKLTKLAAVERVEAIRMSLGLEPEQTIPFSSSTGEGRDELAEAIMGLLDAVRGEQL